MAHEKRRKKLGKCESKSDVAREESKKRKWKGTMLSQARKLSHCLGGKLHNLLFCTFPLILMILASSSLVDADQQAGSPAIMLLRPNSQAGTEAQARAQAQAQADKSNLEVIPQRNPRRRNQQQQSSHRFEASGQEASERNIRSESTRYEPSSSPFALPSNSRIADATGSAHELTLQQLVARRWSVEGRTSQQLENRLLADPLKLARQQEALQSRHLQPQQRQQQQQQQQQQSRGAVTNTGQTDSMSERTTSDQGCHERGISRVIKGRWGDATRGATTSCIRNDRASIVTIVAEVGNRKIRGRLSGAKSLLSDGLGSLMQQAKSSGLVLGSGLLAATIPLVVFLLPDSSPSQSNKRSQMLDSLFMFGQPAKGGFSLQARVDSMMSWIERSIEHLPSFPRLHPQECVKRSICEAHNDPEKYGAIGFVLRLLFPATNLNSTDAMDNLEYKVINKYRHAAGFGLSRRLDNNGTTPEACKDKYEDCLVSLLDVGKKMIDVFLTK